MPRYFYLLAICLGAFIPVYSSALHFQALSVITGAFFLFWRSPTFRVVGLLCVGALISTWQLQNTINSQLPKELEKQDLLVTLVTENGVSKKGEVMRFKGRVLAMNRAEMESCMECRSMIGRRIRLSWRRHGEFSGIAAGQKWTFTVRLKRPRGFVNPAGFDYQAWLLSSGISATGYVRKSSVPKVDSTYEYGAFGVSAIRESMSSGLASFKYSGLLKALMVGDKSGISPDQWAVFQATGTLHLMAISGLHIGLVAMIGFLLVRFLLGAFPLSYSVGTVRYVPAAASIFLSALYVALSGYGIPAQRAWWAVVLVAGLYIFGRRINPFYLLLYVVLCVVLVNPLAPIQDGFWLSFGAVIVLMLGFAFRSGDTNWLLGLIRAQVLITIGLPIMLITLNLPVSVSGFLANIVVVPVISFVVMPLLFLSAVLVIFSTTAASVFVGVADWVMHALWVYLSRLSEFGGELWVSVQSPWILCFGAMATLLLLMPTAFKISTLAGVLSLAVWFSLSHQEHSVKPTLTVLDVGQGLSVVVNSGKKTLVYDVGARFSDNFDVGSGVVAPFLRARNVRQVDTIVVSHGDGDHSGGLNGLIEKLPYAQILSNHHDAELFAEPCLSGHHFYHEVISYSVIWPQSDMLGDSSSNNDSCVLLVEALGFTILLAGDIEKAVEETLMSNGLLPKDIDILIAPHHGSNTSSSTSFLNWLNPKEIIVSAGYLNRYRHPSKAVLKRYEEIEAKVWNTAIHGAVTVELEAGHSPRLFSEREREKKPWFD